MSIRCTDFPLIAAKSAGKRAGGDPAADERTFDAEEGAFTVGPAIFDTVRRSTASTVWVSLAHKASRLPNYYSTAKSTRPARGHPLVCLRTTHGDPQHRSVIIRDPRTITAGLGDAMGVGPADARRAPFFDAAGSLQSARQD